MTWPTLTADEIREKAKAHGYEPEEAFQGWVLDLAMILRFNQVYHTHNSRHSAGGFPDLVMLSGPADGIESRSAKSAVAYLELKGVGRDGRAGLASVEQTWWIEGLAAVGGNTFAAVVYPWQRTELERELRALVAG